MPDTQPTPSADPSKNGGQPGGDGAAPSGAGAADPSQEALLQKFNEMTGRDFTSLDEAKKHYDNLNSLVGNARLREDAQLMDSFVKQYATEQGITTDEARTRIEATLKGQPPTNAPASSAPASRDPEVARLLRKDFLRDHPEASEHIEKIERYAKAQGTDLETAFSDLYGSVFKKQEEDRKAEEQRKEKTRAQVSASESIPEAPAGSQERKMLDQYKQTGNRQFLLEAIKLRDARLARSMNAQ